jgi:hypothetical protein
MYKDKILNSQFNNNILNLKINRVKDRFKIISNFNNHIITNSILVSNNSILNNISTTKIIIAKISNRIIMVILTR